MSIEWKQVSHRKWVGKTEFGEYSVERKEDGCHGFFEFERITKQARKSAASAMNQCETHCKKQAEIKQISERFEPEMTRLANEPHVTQWQPIVELDPSKIDTDNVMVNIMGKMGSTYWCVYSKTDQVWKYEDFDPDQGEYFYFPVPEPIGFILIESPKAAQARGLK